GAGPLMQDALLETDTDAAAWVRSGGDERTAPILAATLAELLPDVAVEQGIVRPCLGSLNESTYPYIGFADHRPVVPTQGRHGVTMADELGRLAARLAIDGSWRDSLPPEPFALRYA